MSSSLLPFLTRMPLALLFVLLVSLPAQARVPQVVADIAPVQSLVARVMQGVAEPSVIVPADASPHHYALRPSTARALAGADLVFWMGPTLLPWMEKPLSGLADAVTIITLLDLPDTLRLPVRQGATFEVHNHEDHDDQDDNATHASGDEAVDPHAWLDPRNARIWLGVIAEALSRIDPEHASEYAENAQAGVAELKTLEADMRDRLRQGGAPFIVFHDAYQYFEARFGIQASGSISLADGAAPGPARLLAVQRKVRDLRIACAFSEPQFDPTLIRTVFEDLPLRVGILDPLGRDLTPGPTLYPLMLQHMGEAILACRG